MKRIIILLFFLFLTIQPSGALTLEGGVTYTVETARAAAFDGVATKIDMSPYKEYLQDKSQFENKLFIMVGNLEPKEGVIGDNFHQRKIVPFKNKQGRLLAYGIQYEDMPDKKFYYTEDGYLLKIEFDTFKGIYPYKTISYNPRGKLININFIASKNKHYIYDNKKKFLGHWENMQFYSSDGEKTLTRGKG